MDAERLIDMSRLALARSRAVAEVVAEAWQAQLLAQAIGGQLVALGPPELSRDARGLAETGGPGSGGHDRPGGAEPVRGGARAVLLTGIDDPREALIALGALLADVGIALVGVACATDEEGLYWHCVEAMDAADEAGDRVRAMLRRLSAADLAGRDLRRPPGVLGERAGPPGSPPAAVPAGVPGPLGARAQDHGPARGTDRVPGGGALPPAEDGRRNGTAVRDGRGHAPGAAGPVAGRPAVLPPGPARADGPVSCHVPLPPRAPRGGGAPALRPPAVRRPEGPTGGGPDRAEALGVPDAVDSTAGSP
ncbi:DUF6099 family protein [Streptomyces sp. NPDC003691]